MSKHYVVVNPIHINAIIYVRRVISSFEFLSIGINLAAESTYFTRLRAIGNRQLLNVGFRLYGACAEYSTLLRQLIIL